MGIWGWTPPGDTSFTYTKWGKVYILLLELSQVRVTAAVCWGEGLAVYAPDAKGAVM